MTLSWNLIGGSGAAALLVCGALAALPAAAQPSPDKLIGRMDEDRDGRISESEFTGKEQPFSFFDRDGDGYATHAEVDTAFAELYGNKGGTKKPCAPTRTMRGPQPTC